MSLVKEFKQFAMRGNVIDLAVGVIMGGAFSKIVSSLVADVLMPPIGFLIGGIKFTELKISLPSVTITVPDAAHPGEFVPQTLDAATINYGAFLQATFDFLIVATCIFVMIKLMNALKLNEQAAPPPPPADVALLTEIRDLLKSKAT